MSNYIGITIGPIVDTMMQTSTPAGLWYASYFFSSVTRDICLEIQNKEGYEILSLPMEKSSKQSVEYDQVFRVNNHLKDNIGIGTYHDRIYIQTEKTWEEAQPEVKEAISKAIEVRAEELPNCNLPNSVSDTESIKEALTAFLEIRYICLHENEVGENGIVGSLSETLDTLELSGKTIKEPENNPLYKVLRGNKDGSNTYIKNIQVLKDAININSDRFLLAENCDGIQIHDLAWIASRGKSETSSSLKKTEKYFAIVQCDGDNMTAIGKKEPNGKGCGLNGKNFSNLCTEYTSRSVELIAKYGGVVIYAGGDDLLFLAPVIGDNPILNHDKDSAHKKENITVWELCQIISEEFDNKFETIYGNNILGIEDNKAKPALSFGVSINYYKFALYEAFSDAMYLLFEEAKKYCDGRTKEKLKNNIAIKVHKASGQTAGFVCCMNTNKDAGDASIFADFISFINDYFLEDSTEDDKKNIVMHSVIYHMESMRTLFKSALSNGKSYARNCFTHVFDNDMQVFGKEMVDRVVDLSIIVHTARENKLIKGFKTGEDKEPDVTVLTSMLRVAKFLLEDEKNGG